MNDTPWHVLTGEYPPQIGGVADYARALARELALSLPAPLHVWAPAAAEGVPRDPGIQVHGLEGGFSPWGLAQLSVRLRNYPRGRLLVHYVPHAYGYRGLNLPLVEWIARWRRDEVWIMFHEVALVFDGEVRLRRRAAAALSQHMARRVAGRADRMFVSTSTWIGLLERVTGRATQAEVLAIPSNLPTHVEPGDVARIRELLSGGSPVVGHFGTYGPQTADLVRDLALELDRSPTPVTFYLLGRGGEEFAQRELSPLGLRKVRVECRGGLATTELAVHLAACDVLLQPYPDGATTRRTTLMAGLGLGVPVVTNLGRLSEDWWGAEGAVGLAPEPDARRMVELVQALLRDPSERAALGARGRRLYERRFSLERSAKRLLELAEGR